MIGCDAPVSFFPESEKDEVSITSLGAGEMVSAKTNVPLSLSYDAEKVQFSKLEIILTNSEGTVLAKETLKGEEIQPGPLPSIALPTLLTGQYNLHYLLYTEEDENQYYYKHEIPFFYVQGTYSLTGISSYPPVVPIGSTALLEAHILAPLGANPYMRWSIAENVIREGFVSEGLRTIQWSSPSVEGAYSITAELFPVKPEGSVYITSPLSVKTEIFVASSGKAGRNELEPAASYANLLHFRGDIKDYGYTPLNLTTFGDPSLDVKGTIFGYSLNGTAGFRYERMILPVADGIIQPGTLEFRLFPVSLGQKQVLFSTKTSDGGFSLTLDIGHLGQGNVRITGKTFSWETESKPGWAAVNEAANLALTIKPSGKDLQLLLYKEGILFHQAAITAPLPVVSREGYTIIGAGDPASDVVGFKGILDEFGLFTRDDTGRAASNPWLFRKAMKEKHGTELFLAEGFTGVFLPSDIKPAGAVSLDWDYAVLGPESLLSLPLIELNHETLSFEIDMQSAEGGIGRILIEVEENTETENKKEPPLTLQIDNTGRIQLPDGEEQPFTSEGGAYKLQISHIENSLLFSWKEGSYTLELTDERAALNVRFMNAAKEGVVTLDRILILSKNQNLARDKAGRSETAHQEEVVREDAAADPSLNETPSLKPASNSPAVKVPAVYSQAVGAPAAEAQT